MKYIYIFDYTFNHIYEISINDKEKLIKDIESYLIKNYHININTSEYMVSSKKLEIETIDKI